jgi:OOP family OmpA-OmpF porin
VFDSNSFSIRSKNPAMDARNMQNVQMVGAFLKQNPRAKAVLHGFSDGKGAPDYNLKLSRRRAEAVAKHLEREFGIPESRVAIIAHGMSQDVFRTGRNRLPGQGRRVEFEIFR